MSKRPEQSLLRRQRRREGAWSPGNTHPTRLARQGSPANEDAEQLSAGRRNMSQSLRGGLRVLEAERTSPDAHHLRAGEHTAQAQHRGPRSSPRECLHRGHQTSETLPRGNQTRDFAEQVRLRRVQKRLPWCWRADCRLQTGRGGRVRRHAALLGPQPHEPLGPQTRQIPHFNQQASRQPPHT